LTNAKIHAPARGATLSPLQTIFQPAPQIHFSISRQKNGEPIRNVTRTTKQKPTTLCACRFLSEGSTRNRHFACLPHNVHQHPNKRQPTILFIVCKGKKSRNYHTCFSASINVGSSHRKPTCMSYRLSFTNSINCSPKRCSATGCITPAFRNA